MNKRIAFGLLLVSLSCHASWAAENSDLTKQLEKENAFLGIAHSVVQTTTFKQKTAGFGYLVERVLQNTAADVIGLEEGDIIIAIDQQDFSIVEKKDRRQFLVKYIRKKQMGDDLFLTVLRKTQDILIEDGLYEAEGTIQQVEGSMQAEGFKHAKGSKHAKGIYKVGDINQLKKLIDRQNPDSKLIISINIEVHQLELVAVLGVKATVSEDDLPENSEIFPEYELLKSPYNGLVLKDIKENELTKQYDNLLHRFKKDELWDDGFRLNLIRYLHRDPLKLLPVVDKRMKLLQVVSEEDQLTKTIQYLSGWLDVVPDTNTNTQRHPVTNVLEDHKRFIKETLSLAEQLRVKAFEKLSEEEMDFLRKEAPLLMQRFEKSFYIARPDEKNDKGNNTKVVMLAKKVDFSSLFQAAETVSILLDAHWLDTLKKSLENNKTFALQTDAGKVVVGGFGDDVYGEKVALIIDFQGNDIYKGDSSRVDGIQGGGISLIIDLAGNDEYQHTRKYAQGSAFMGIGILYDQEGDDVYTAKSYSQAFSLFGVGVLVDGAGNDRYFSNHLTQGAAFWGISLLLDHSGNDNYHANFYAQGLGGTKGIAALIDHKGDDHYFATGEKESSYQVSGIFQSASQGVGIGFRGYSSGGVGVLLDSAGNNEFRSGNFSQGVGYFFGLGVLYASGQGDDRYQGSRYSQGSSAHSAMGVLIDEGGNDQYLSLSGVSQAASWDLASAALWDKAGNDRYQGSNAFASQNGFSLFVDEAGDDSYDRILNGGSNDYHGGFSLGVFIDAAGEDEYLSEGGDRLRYENNKKTMLNGYGLFSDF